MKRLLFLLPLLLVSTACAKEPALSLGPVEEANMHTVKLKKNNCGLTTSYSTEEITTTLKSLDDENVEYSVKIGSSAKQHSDYDEFVLADSSYVKANSNYVVDRLIIDFYGPSVKFAVYNNLEGSGTELEYHESTVESDYPTEYGVVYEYAINGKEWTVKNVSAPYKSSFYSISVVFVVE